MVKAGLSFLGLGVLSPAASWGTASRRLEFYIQVLDFE